MLGLHAKWTSNLFSKYSAHHSNFSPNWTCRELVEVEVMTPAVGEGPDVAEVNTTGFGLLKFV